MGELLWVPFVGSAWIQQLIFVGALLVCFSQEEMSLPLPSKNTFLVSAPAKVILFGEHAVVYGKAAIAASVGLRCYAYIAPPQTQLTSIVLDMFDLNVHIEWNLSDLKVLRLQLSSINFDNIEECKSVIECFLESRCSKRWSSIQTSALVTFLYLDSKLALDSQPQGYHLQFKSFIPVGAGLGSSAAYSVSLSSSLLLWYGHIEHHGNSNISPDILELVNKWAFHAEKMIHGNPSGVDNSISVYGGAKVFRKGTLNKIEKFSQLRFLLINTHIPRSTKVLVSGLKEKYLKHTGIMELVFGAVEEISQSCLKLFNEELGREEAVEKLGELIKMNQLLLTLCGVSHPSLESICSISNKFGLSSKLTGAGGGGCALTLLPDEIEESIIKEYSQEIEMAGYSTFTTHIGVDGVTWSNVTDESIKTSICLKELTSEELQSILFSKK